MGEAYEAEIVLGGTISQAEFAVSVNGAPLRVEDYEKAKYAARPGSIGTQSYTKKQKIKKIFLLKMWFMESSLRQ